MPITEADIKAGRDVSGEGTRRRREPPIVAECACGWRSRPYSPKKAEKRFAAHFADRHAEPRASSSLSPNTEGNPSQ
jgi:hypothetical protein